MKYFHLLIATVSLGLVAGCSKKEETPEVAPAAEAEAPAPDAAAAPAPQAKPQAEAQPKEKLPGAAGVRRDLQNKNYNDAVQGVVLLKAVAASGDSDMWQEYRQLAMDVTIALNEAARTDPAAARALAAYNAASSR